MSIEKPNSNCTFLEFSQWWFNEVKVPILIAKGVVRKTIDDYWTSIRHAAKYFEDEHPRMKMKSITENTLKDMIEYLLQYGSERTAEKVYDIVFEMRNDFCRHYDIEVRSIRREAFYRSKKVVDSSKKLLTPADCKAIAEAAIAKYPTGTPVNRLGYAVVVLAYSQFESAEELLGLKWSDINLEDNVLTVSRKAIQQPLYGGGYMMEIKPLKTPRTFKFSEKVANAFAELYKITGNCEYVMTTSEGKIMSANAFGKMYRGSVKRAGINKDEYESISAGTFCRIKVEE